MPIYELKTQLDIDNPPNIMENIFNNLPFNLKMAILAGCEIETDLVRKGEKYIFNIKTKHPVGVVFFDGQWHVAENRNVRQPAQPPQTA